MLLPDNIQPEYSIYYSGSIIIEKLKGKNCQSIIELFHSVNDSMKMSFSLYTLSLDWLYLIDVAKINDKGEVCLCL